MIRTKHGELTIEQLAEVQPGMARLMKEIGERYNIAYHGAKGGNWKLAHHEIKQVIALMRAAITLRPKYSRDLEDFIFQYLDPFTEIIRNRDWLGFKAAFQRGIDSSNELHEKYGYGFIRFVRSKNPPENYDLQYKE